MNTPEHLIPFQGMLVPMPSPSELAQLAVHCNRDFRPTTLDPKEAVGRALWIWLEAHAALAEEPKPARVQQRLGEQTIWQHWQQQKAAQA